MEPGETRLFISDVDGTLLNAQKELSPATVQAVHDLQSAGILFSLVSQRPLQGLKKIAEILKLHNSCAALNGGVITDSALTVISEKHVRSSLLQGIVGTIERYGLDPWIYTRTRWYVSRCDGPHVLHEADVLGFSPVPFETLSELSEPVIKITAVSDHYDQVNDCERYLKQHFGNQLAIVRSLANHLDISHPDANKGSAVISIAGQLGIPLNQVATAGDGENDIPMFRVSGFSIAMGQGSAEVHRAAAFTTTSNAQDGLAWAINDLILKHCAK